MLLNETQIWIFFTVDLIMLLMGNVTISASLKKIHFQKYSGQAHLNNSTILHYCHSVELPNLACTCTTVGSPLAMLPGQVKSPVNLNGVVLSKSPISYSTRSGTKYSKIYI